MMAEKEANSSTKEKASGCLMSRDRAFLQAVDGGLSLH